MRESSVRGPAVDLSEFERRMRGEAPRAAAKSDPLSELARLMHGGQEEADPFGDILPDPRAARARPQPAPEWDGALRGSLDAPPPIAPEPRGFDPGAAHYPEADWREPAPQARAAAQDDARFGAPYGGAEGGWADDSDYLDYGAEESPEPGRDGGWRRFVTPARAAAAIGVVAVVSIGWGFMHRGGVGGSKEIAVIDAPEGPVKVKPTADAEKETPDASGAAVLDRKEATTVKQIVSHQEQAIDPTVSPRVAQLGSGPVDAPHEPMLQTQPKKVKTVTVRPDGSKVDDAGLPPAVTRNAAPPADPAPRGATPKPETKTATTPPAKPKPAPKVAAVEPPPAAEETAAAAPATSSGSYAVQFGAAGSEDEARALLKTVAAKYGVKATFKPAKVGDKTVYRVRVGGVSKDSANAICNKVKSSGGSCFVAAN
jgi:cell division septation protein DedD